MADSNQEYPLRQRLPAAGEGRTLHSDEILDRFLDYLADAGLKLYPAQEEAILEIFEGHNVILNTPTGSGKSLVAVAMHFRAMALGRRSYYTCPIKALVNEKFLSLCYEFGPDAVGLITGDATVNAKAPIICCTAEILANLALRQGEEAPVEDVVMDEFHYYADRERGMAWQIPLLTLSKCRFLLMSATMGETSFFEKEIAEFTGVPCKTILSDKRPVPLEHQYEENTIETVLEKLVGLGKVPIYVVNFTQKNVALQAQALTCVNYCSKEEKAKIAEELVGVKFSTPYGKDIKRLLRHGIGIHHAGLLPRYRLQVEKLAQKGLLKIICGTDTLGVGINVPIRTVLFTRLCKYNGEKMSLLTAREFHQIGGRAGRKGFDESGTVVVMAPEYVVENKLNEEKARLKGKKVAAKAKPPEKGFLPWSRGDFERLLISPPEPLRSSFKVNHSMLLNVLSRPAAGIRAMKTILRTCHESDHSKRRLRSEAMQLFRSLVDRKIIEFAGPGAPSPLRLNVHLQDNFSINHDLSLFFLDAIDLLDPYCEDYNLRILTLAESIVENPDAILFKQLDRVKRDRLFELKSQGVEYEERMQELEKLEWPKPDRDFIYNTFNLFKARHPWVGEENIRPKSIARELFETMQSFNDYIQEYGLERSEGVLLRYLCEVYKVMTQTIPERLKTEPVMEVIESIAATISEVDSSLLEEWERLKDPIQYASREKLKSDEEKEKKEDLGILHDLPAFTNLVRNSVFRFIRFMGLAKWDQARECLENGVEWSEGKLEQAMEGYLEIHGELLTTPNARNKNLTTITKLGEDQRSIWRIEQTLADPEGDNDWSAILEVDLAKSREMDRPVLSLRSIAEKGL